MIQVHFPFISKKLFDIIVYRACSSEDRALVSGTKGRAFESRQAHSQNPPKTSGFNHFHSSLDEVSGLMAVPYFYFPPAPF